MKKIFILFLVLFFGFSISGTAQRRASKRKEHKKELTEKDHYVQADLFMQALREKELNNPEKANELLDEAIEINPKDAASHYEKAKVLQLLGRNDEALEEASLAAGLDSSNKWYQVLYAKLSKLNENYDNYVAVYEQLVEDYPADLNFLQELAFAYYFTGDYEKAVWAFGAIEEKVGLNERLTTQKVQLYSRLGQPEKAVAEYERLIEENPDDPRYYALLAEFCTKNKMEDKAIWAYKKIVELNPDDPFVHISLAEFYKKKGDGQKAFEELKLGMANNKLLLKTKINLLFSYYSGPLSDGQKKQALELSGILKKTHPDEVMGESFHATMLYENEEYEAARTIFRDILKEDSGNYGFWEQLLFCDLYLEDYPQLSKDAEDAIDYFPSYPLPYFFAGIGNFQIKDFVKAQAFLESGKDFVVNNNALLEQFYSSLGDTYNELENYHASYAAYDKVLSMNPENAVVLNNYSYYLSLRSEQLEKAEKMAAKAVELDPYNQNNLDTFAWVLYKMQKFEEALEWIKKAYNNGGESSGVVLEHYGDILYRLGETEKAMGFWLRAKQKADHSELLDKKLQDGKLYE
ncbi:MAG: tetratricopeptide repeat protein [Bacteroidales bacterium]|nr:tetratricopeptide repeat protein [Bacteroidales bacterium]